MRSEADIEFCLSPRERGVSQTPRSPSRRELRAILIFVVSFFLFYSPFRRTLVVVRRTNMMLFFSLIASLRPRGRDDRNKNDRPSIIVDKRIEILAWTIFNVRTEKLRLPTGRMVEGKKTFIYKWFQTNASTTVYY